jgi:hypothetical protein
LAAFRSERDSKALTGETEALALIDPTSRYVVVIPLADREASTWLQPFLDRIVEFGAPDMLHSDAAPQFLSEALDLLAQAADIRTTTTLGHNARGNGTIEVFWRFCNRCMRMLPDDHYCCWPGFALRMAFAYNTACHDSIALVLSHRLRFSTGLPPGIPSSLLSWTHQKSTKKKTFVSRTNLPRRWLYPPVLLAN